MAEFFTIFFTEKDQRICDSNVTKDIHVYKGINDIFEFESGRIYKINFEQKWIKDMETKNKNKIIKTWVESQNTTRFVVTEKSIISSYKMNVDEILEKYSHFIGLRWKDMKGDSEYVEFRKLIVDSLLDESILWNQCKSVCTFNSVGTVTNYSDYDINVSGPNATEVVERFNERFREIFGMESSTAFDTNIYGSSFVHEVHQTNFKEYTYKSDDELRKFYYVSGTDRRDQIKQRKWALLKLFSNLDNKEIIIMDYAYKMIKDLVDELSLRKSGNDDPKTLNLLYIEMLKENQKYKKKMLAYRPSDPEEANNLKFHYKDSLSRANYFGNEMYYTQGAFIHVVMNIQSKINIPVTKNEYMDSFIENMGDLFGILNKHDPEKDSCLDLIEKISKYFSRATDALIKLGFLELKDIYEISEDIRVNVRNKEKKTSCQELEPECLTFSKAEKVTISLLTELGLENCSQLRAYMFNFLDKYVKLHNLNQ